MIAVLDDAARAWVTMHETAMRKAAAAAIDASNRWRGINAELTEKWKAEGLDDLQIARAKDVNLALADAYGGYTFNAGKAQMHAAVLQGALAARQLMAAGDPTGFGYSREDDQPAPAPVPPGVDGLSITGRPPRRAVTQQGGTGAGVPVPPATRADAA
ncbi:hypothetical protein AWW66_03510 [Micromonospora rosaria]|uniref:Uncharacterized protein n=1 Tax=Micromonospora rosaria TaxID=47874 RepID=A0A136PYN6_9ACTN|nr:hypothetical protein [Micromonospora rosaria]KXK63394.1 hypothetical protein AWW66_03510 [Micromonospora rosaria]